MSSRTVIKYQVNDTTHRSPNFNERKPVGQKVETIVLHYTVTDFQTTMAIFADAGKQASTHYVIDQNAREVDGIFRLVDEGKRAWHAGQGSWHGNVDQNSAGIGIELVNLTNSTIIEGQEVFTWQPFDPNQFAALTWLLKDMVSRSQNDRDIFSGPIKPINVIGHSDSAPGRKSDPGPLFPWKYLYDNGIGAWYEDADVTYFEPKVDIRDIKNIQKKLQKYGYTSITQIDGIWGPQTSGAVRSFKMHFNPELNDKQQVDSSVSRRTIAILEALVKKYESFLS